MIAASLMQISLLAFVFHETHLTTPSNTSSPKTHSSWTLASLWVHRDIRAFFLISFVTTMAFSSLAALSSVYYSDRLHLDTQHISYLLAAVGVTSIFFQAVIFPRLRQKYREFLYFFWAFIGLSLSFIFFATITTYTQALVTSILFPLFFGGITPLISAGLSERSRGEI